MSAPALDRPTTRPRRPNHKIQRFATVLLFGVALGWSITGLDITLSRLASAPSDAWGVFSLMFPPDFATEFERGVLGKVFESVYIAWIGTTIAAVPVTSPGVSRRHKRGSDVDPRSDTSAVQRDPGGP